MTWEVREVLVARQMGALPAQVRFEVSEICSVEVACAGEVIGRDGPDLFAALASVRRDLEARRYLLMCNGSRRDVYPSAMQRQALRGRRAYVLRFPRTTAKPESVDIFDPVADLGSLASVDEQRSWFDRWRQSAYVEEGGA
jgi:hypothetical protein